jgi:hypothetical protein
MGGGEFVTAYPFKKDTEKQTFTLCRADNSAQFAYSMVRYSKLTADRYRGSGLQVPGKFEDLAKEHTFRKHWYENGEHYGFTNYSQILRPKER